MCKYDVLIHSEDERQKIHKLLCEYDIHPKIALKIHGELIYQIDTLSKQVYISPAFMVTNTMKNRLWTLHNS